MSRRSLLAALTLTLALTASGCGLEWPRLFHPGTERQQQFQAQVDDPYPDPNIGPSDYSARPRGYMEPQPEATQGRQTRWTMPQFFRW